MNNYKSIATDELKYKSMFNTMYIHKSITTYELIYKSMSYTIDEFYFTSLCLTLQAKITSQ